MAHAGFPEGLGTTEEKVIAGLGNGHMVIEENARLIGECNFRDVADGGAEIGIKTSHRATIAIAILKDYCGIGIGSAMFEELVAAAQNRGTEIMELEFIEGNERAKHLYEKFGFRIVSERPNAFKLKDGTHLSEIYMQKYL